jgi:3,4-dihydroxy 2-butanone 4-phosphate synthase/GTP cyclohydrolase II
VHRDLHLVLTRGELGGAQLPLVRVHVADTLRDLLGVRGDARAWTLREAMRRIAAEPCGALVILRESESPRALADAVQGLPGRDGSAAQPSQSVLRTYGIGAQILKDLGLRRIRVLSAPKQLQGVAGFDLEVVEYVGD